MAHKMKTYPILTEYSRIRNQHTNKKTTTFNTNRILFNSI